MTDIDRAANALLHDAAARQAIVDRLLGRSIWARFVTGTAMLAAASASFLLVWSLWRSGSSDHGDALVLGTLMALVWVSVAVMQVATRLRALSTILERSGVLDRFLGGDGHSAIGSRVRE